MAHLFSFSRHTYECPPLIAIRFVGHCGLGGGCRMQDNSRRQQLAANEQISRDAATESRRSLFEYSVSNDRGPGFVRAAREGLPEVARRLVPS